MGNKSGVFALLGSYKSPPRLGPRLRSTTEPDNPLQQGGSQGRSGRRRLRPRPFLGRRQFGQANWKVDRKQTEGSLRANARYLYLRNQHDSWKGP